MSPALPRLSGAAQEVLGVRLCNWVGEVVLMLPALRRLEAAGYLLYPVGRGWSAGLLEGTGWQVTKRPGPLLEARRSWRDLRRSLGLRHPKALLFTRSLSSAIETRLAGWRPIGHARDGRTPLLSQAYPFRPYRHASHMYWDLVSEALGESAPYPTSNHLAPSARQQIAARTLLDQHRLSAGSYVLLCPFSGADDREQRKVWSGFSELGRRLQEAGTPTVVCPGPGEEARARSVLPAAVHLTGTDLGTYAALLASARAVAANDTGPGHLAAAVGARLVSIYGPASIPAWTPLGESVRLFADPSGWPSPDDVLSALLSDAMVSS